MIVVLDGTNGTGTTTMTTRLHKDNPGSILTRHPGSTPLGQELRKLLKFGKYNTTAQQEILLFAADAMMFYQDIVLPNQDKLIICDRLNIVGAMTYQLAGGAKASQIHAMFKFIKELGWTIPVDKLMIFNAPFEITQARSAKPDLIDQDKETNGKKDRFESRGDDYMMRVADNYRAILHANNWCAIQDVFDGLVKEVYEVDASKDQDAVYKQITDILAT